MKPVTVLGKRRIEEAKVGGITPEVLILSGRCELCPLYIRRPTMRLAYATWMRRCARSMKMMAATTTTMRSAIATARKIDHSPCGRDGAPHGGGGGSHHL